MPNYRRALISGGTYFFTVNLLQRHDNNLLIREINLLRNTVRQVRKRHPFQIDARVFTRTFAFDCMDAGGRATHGAVAECLDIASR